MSHQQQGIPVKLLQECTGHVELKNGDTYAGTMIDCDDFWNCQLQNINHITKDGNVSHLQNVLIRGSNVRFMIIPDMLKGAPMFTHLDIRNNVDVRPTVGLVLSEMPKEIIGAILDHLPSTREAVATEILSKNWKDKWTAIDTLKISDNESNAGYNAFASFIDRTIHNIQNASSVSFVLLKDYEQMGPINEWINIILTRNRVRDLSIYSPDVSCLFLVRSMDMKAIQTLSLEFLTLRAITHSTFPNLKKIHLVGVVIGGERSEDDSLMFDIPLVQEIKIELCEWGVSEIEFRCHGLVKYSTRTYSCHQDGKECKIVISGANLTKFHSRYKLEEYKLNGACRRMVIRSLSNGGNISLDVTASRFIRLLACVCQTLEELETTPFFVEALSTFSGYCELPRVHHVTVSDADDKGQEMTWDGLLTVLRMASNMSRLIIDVSGFVEHDYTRAERPQCVSTTLEEVTLSLTDSDGADGGIELAGYFLRHALALKKLYFKFSGVDEEWVRDQLAHFQRSDVLYSLD